MRYGNSESWGFSSTQAGLGRAIVGKQTSRSEGREGVHRSGKAKEEWAGEAGCRGWESEGEGRWRIVWDAWDWTELSALKLMTWCVAMPH
ncbi:MAG: hypothetical protein ACKERG_00650 [Candidatus Hodgkinia cicadicola]